MPSSTKPLLDSISLVTDLIDQAYRDHAGAKGGIIIVGHSAGAALAVAIAAQPDSQLPVIGLSLLGLVPTHRGNLLIPNPDPDPENPRLSAESMSPMASDFMGPLQYLNGRVFGDGAMIKMIFEPCTDDHSLLFNIIVYQLTHSIIPVSRPEIREYPGPEWHTMLVDNFMPAVKVFSPLQNLNES